VTGHKNKRASLPTIWGVAVPFLLGILVSLICKSHAPAADQDTRSAFQRLYDPHARELQRLYAHGQAKCVQTYSPLNGKQRATQFKAKWSGANYILAPDGGSDHRSSAAQNKSRTLDARNSLYDFTLNPRGDGLYTIADVKLRQPERPTALCFMTVPIADYLYSKQTFSEMVGNERVEFLEFGDHVWHDVPVKRLKVRVKPGHGSNLRNTGEMTVAFYFSPSAGWVCVGMQSQDGKNAAIQREERYIYGTTGGQTFPALERLEVWRTAPKSYREIDTEITDLDHHKPFPESDFTLSAFGLPEPYGVVWKKPIPWYLWFIGSGVSFLALGWYFRRRIQRRSVASAPPIPAG
jgi:hypothetical protein